MTEYKISYIIILVKGPRPRTRGPVAIRGVAADPNRRARRTTYKLNKRHLTLHRGLDILGPVAMPKGIIQFEGGGRNDITRKIRTTCGIVRRGNVE